MQNISILYFKNLLHVHNDFQLKNTTKAQYM